MLLIPAVMLGVQSPRREWSDPSGKFRVQAELVSVRGDKVILEKADGSIVTVPIEKLCQADRDFIKENASPKTTPNPSRPSNSDSIEKPSPSAFGEIENSAKAKLSSQRRLACASRREVTMKPFQP